MKLYSLILLFILILPATASARDNDHLSVNVDKAGDGTPIYKRGESIGFYYHINSSAIIQINNTDTNQSKYRVVGGLDDDNRNGYFSIVSVFTIDLKPGAYEINIRLNEFNSTNIKTGAFIIIDDISAEFITLTILLSLFILLAVFGIPILVYKS